VGYRIRRTVAFQRQAVRFFRGHPELREPFGRLVQDLATNPVDPRLRLHALRGKYQGFYAVSLTYSYRVTLTIDGETRTITLHDIGPHDRTYR